jgi:hypothetical protein
MDRTKRIRRINAIKRFAAGEDPDFGNIQEIPSSGQFGNHEIIKTDFDLVFEPGELDEAFSRAANKEWITLVEEAKRRRIPYLFYLDPAKSTVHEKYFGVKTDEFGFIDTPASASLGRAAAEGKVPRNNWSQVKKLEVPAELRTKFGTRHIFTLDLAGERTVIQHSVRFLQGAKGNPARLRRIDLSSGTDPQFTTTYESRHEPARMDAPSALESRLRALERGLDKGIDTYPLLAKTVNRFLTTLDNRIDNLLSEQQAKNPTVKFHGGKQETTDILRQNILRLIIKSLEGELSPLAGSKVYEEEDKLI